MFLLVLIAATNNIGVYPEMTAYKVASYSYRKPMVGLYIICYNEPARSVIWRCWKQKCQTLFQWCLKAVVGISVMGSMELWSVCPKPNRWCYNMLFF